MTRPRSDPHGPVLVAGRRTAIGTAGHAFAGSDVISLTAPVLHAVASTVAPLDRPIDDVIIGNCMGPGGNIARVSALAAGLGNTVPGVTVDRQCGSGLEAVLQAATRIRAGEEELILAGGAESASTAPWRCWPPDGAAAPVRYERAPFAPNGFPDPGMGEAADALARLRGISRRRQDEYAARSHRLTFAARERGRFDAEIVPVDAVERDERPRAGMDTGRLSRLRPSFGADGTATAGSSCGISDGAAAVAVCREAAARGAGIAYLRVVAGTVAADRPELPGMGTAAAVRRLLRRPSLAEQRLTVGDVAAVEITEAFASVVLAAIDDLELDEDTVCAEGGAIGLGHPWGASGTILILRLMSRMLTPATGSAPRYGLAACAIGGGQGLAVLLENPVR